MGSLWAQFLLEFSKKVFANLHVFCHGQKMCMCFWGYPPVICYQLFFNFFDALLGPVNIRIDTLWVQLILQFSTYNFNYAYLLYTVCGLGVILRLFFINLFHFFDLVFQGPISIGIDILLAQFRLELLWNYAYLFYMVWRCVCGFWIVLLSYGFKNTTLYWQSHDVGGRLSAMGFYVLLHCEIQ